MWHAMGVMLSAAGSLQWLRAALGDPPYDELLAEAERWEPGIEGLLFQPYLAGERTQEGLPGTHRCAFRTATAPRQRAKREWRGRWMNIQRSHIDNAVDLHGPDRDNGRRFMLWHGKRHPCKRGDALLRARIILLFERFIWTRECTAPGTDRMSKKQNQLKNVD